MIDESNLVKHSILDEESDWRIHVCYRNGNIYIFPTENAKPAIRNGNYRIVPAKTGDLITADGWLVPPLDIEGCKKN